MKKVKIALWVVIFGFVGLLIFQNRGFFMADSRLMLDLGFFYYETPFLANAIFFVAFFLVGVLISYFFGLFRQFRDAKTIKMLKAKEASLVETVSSLEKRISNSEATAAAAPVDVPPIVEEKPLETADEVK
jgi:membrane protein implicated in regulation of membrane protease activity